MSDVENLKQLGSTTTVYLTDKPRPELLETFKNIHPENLTLVTFIQEHDEFTSTCGKTKQPDNAKMEFIYVPNELMIESKSVKLYLFSFRNYSSFHEDICNEIANTLFEKLQPKYLRVFGKFTPRGGIAIRPMVEKWEQNYYFQGCDYRDSINRLVSAWDSRNQ